jgi:hypothetical protein
MKLITTVVIVLVVFGIAGLFLYSMRPKIIDEGGLTLPTPIVSNSTNTPDETQSIESQIKAALVQKYGENSKDLEVTITQNLGGYTKGLVNDPAGGGGMWFGAKVGDNWELVWDGNGIITCDDLKDYPDFPSSLIPQCFDQDSQKMITR